MDFDQYDLNRLLDHSDAPTFQLQHVSMSGNTVVMPLIERATGQERTVIVAFESCAGCGGVHARPTMLVLDRAHDALRFVAPAGAEVRFDHG